MLDVKPLTRVFRALGDETRLRIVALLAHGELCVCHLVSALELSQPNVSRHLAALRGADLVEVRREGGWAYYRLAAHADDAVRRVVAALTRDVVGDRVLRADHARLRRACGPAACR